VAIGLCASTGAHATSPYHGPACVSSTWEGCPSPAGHAWLLTASAGKAGRPTAQPGRPTGLPRGGTHRAGARAAPSPAGSGTRAGSAPCAARATATPRPRLRPTSTRRLSCRNAYVDSPPRRAGHRTTLPCNPLPWTAARGRAGDGCAPSSLSCQTACVRLSGRAASERNKAQLGATCTPGSAGVAHLPPPALPLSSAICGARNQRLERSAV